MTQEFSYEKLMDRYGERIAAARAQLAKTWKWENHDRPAVIFSDVNYALCGQTDVPENYFEPRVMFRYQVDKILLHLQTIRDDYVPVLHPWYGTTVVPSACGVAVHYGKEAGIDPSLGRPILNEPEDILKLKKPDPEHDGQMPRVLECIRYMRDHTDIPVCLTDGQGPLNIALGLAGVENLFIWMYEEPEAVHQLMQFCTDVMKDWVTVQKKWAGHSLTGDAYPHAIELPAGYGGIAMADDDLTAMSAAQYQEFVVPYNEQLLQAFGGGSMHFCGSAHHQVDVVTGMKGLNALNNFCMGDFEQIEMLHGRMKGKGALMACDFNAASIPWHAECLRRLAQKPEGYVLGIFITPAMALLENGKYTSSCRTRDEIVAEYQKQLEDLLPRD